MMMIKYISLCFFSILLSIGASGFTIIEPASTTDRIITPTAVYGPENAAIKLSIGNGGAGPTCLLQALSEDFIASEKLHMQIAWVQNISRLTLENLKRREIDISLTYEELPEISAIQEGWATERTLVFNDHFIIVGPKENPANLVSTDTPEQAFQKIHKSGSFLSRDDLSGSNKRERQIWKAIKLQPWTGSKNWYHKSHIFPADALIKADQQGHYTLTDRGSLLAIHGKLKNTAVYIQHGDNMMNRCHALLQHNPSELAKAFLTYLKSSRAQTLILGYSGKDKNCVACCPLFTPAHQDQFLDHGCLNRIGLAPHN
ncbi:MAG TPA: substrate-binding domain-containing protein [Parachlamydiaceae bacterium]|nr:substrate-binding domain-containing protein [Parachlamydiaceae bacterium]